MPARTAERDYSGTPLPRKLGIHEGSEVLILAEGAHQPLAGPYDVVVFFALTQAEVARRFAKLAARLEPNGRLWICWPKRSSGIATDVTESSLREIILPSGLVDNKVAAIDESWSGLQFVIRLKDRVPAAG